MSDIRARAIHAHPFSILTFLYRFLFLLIIPLARGFISALTGDIFSWVRGAWFDILIVALIIILAYQKWEHFQYHMDINGVYIATGIFFRSEFYIPQDRISTLSVIRPFWLRPFRIARIRIDTIAGDPRSPDAAFYVWSREADRFSSLRAAPPAMDSDGAPAQDRPHLYELVLLSLLTSNSFIGIVFIATFFSHMGQILGEELSGILVTTFEELSRRIAFGLPPIFAGAALLLLCGWLVAFCISLLQVKNLFVRRSENTLHVSGGVLVQKEFSAARRRELYRYPPKPDNAPSASIFRLYQRDRFRQGQKIRYRGCHPFLLQRAHAKAPGLAAPGIPPFAAFTQAKRRCNL